MKKLVFGITCSLLLVMVACGGGKKEKVKSFADTFAGYVNAGQLDSIKAVYPSVNFDSVAHVSTDSVKISDTDGITRVDFGGGKWIELEYGDSGDITVVNSKGIAAFPEDKLQLAINTGMLNDSTADTKAQDLLNDSIYFAWLNDKAKDSYENALTLTLGKSHGHWGVGEGQWVNKWPVTVKNNLPITLGANDYKINYTLVGAAEESTNWKPWYMSGSTKGKEVGPGQSVEIILSHNYAEITKPKIVLNLSIEEYLDKYYKPTGKEYQEYLDSKK